MKLRLYAVVVCVGVMAFGGCSRNNNEVLADVNGRKILAEEFSQRYRKYLNATSERDNIVVRKKVLTNMINEQLVFQDLRRRGMDSDDSARTRLQDITGQAALDGYAKLVTVDTMTVSEGELWREFRAFNSKVSAWYVLAKSERDAVDLKKRLERGESFEKIAREVFDDPDLKNNGGYLGYFGYGDMEPALQEAAYSLPVGALSDPIKLKSGYGILRIENRVEAPLASEIDFAKRKPELEDKIRERKIVSYLKQEADNIERDLDPEFNAIAVEFVLKNWNYLLDKTASPSSTELRDSGPGDGSSLELVKFKGSTWSVAQFLSKVEKTRTKDRKRVKSADDVRQVVVGLAVRQVLLDRASKAGVEQFPRVQEQIKRVWEDYLLRRWANSVEDTVGKSEFDEKLLLEEYEKNKDLYAEPPETNVAEILVRTEDQARNVLEEVKKGSDFASLARQHSIRIWAAKKGGELGFAPPAAFAPLGGVSQQIFSSKVGRVIGPVYVQPYYGLYMILGFKKGRARSFREVKAGIIETMLPRKKKEAFTQAVDHLRSRATIETDIKALGNIVTTPN